jgi:hypothetical protein
MIHFDADSHTYTLDGQRLPSVTEVLKPLSDIEYRCVDKAVMERAATLGKAVHKLIELDLGAELDEDGLDDALRPYLAQWRAFRALSGFDALLSEQAVHSAKYGYAGTLDLFGTLNGRHVLIDAKRTAAVPRTAGPQTAGYEIALRESSGNAKWLAQPIHRYALHLTPERWTLVPFKDPSDSRVYLSALTLHNWSHQK